MEAEICQQRSSNCFKVASFFWPFRPSNNNLFVLAKNLQNKLQELDDIIQQGGLALKSERESLTYFHFNVKENHILIVNRYRIMAEEDNETE